MSKIQFLPHQKTVEVHAGTSILAAARKGKVLLQSKCGGRGACTACKVQVQSPSGSLSPLSRMEKHMLSDQMIKDGFRLGCQCQVTGEEVVVSIPEDPLRRTIRLQLEAARREKEQQESEQRKP